MSFSTRAPFMLASIASCAALCNAQDYVASREAELFATPPTADQFAANIAVSNGTALVGHPRTARPGIVEVHVRSGSQWNRQATLVAGDANPGDGFGAAVDIEGDTAVVAAPSCNPFGTGALGAAYVFVRSGTTWTQQARLVAPGADLGDGDGMQVAISGDTLVVSLPRDDHAAFEQAGTLRVFTRTGTTWSPQALLFASDEQSFRSMGWDLAIDGDTAVASVPLHGLYGKAYVFVRSAGAWFQQEILDPLAFEGPLHSLDLDGDLAVLGYANGDPFLGTPGGCAIPFERVGGVWTRGPRLTTPAHHTAGAEVALDVGRLLVADPGSAAPHVPGAGALFLFERSAGSWTIRCPIYADQPAQNEFLGFAVAIDGDALLATREHASPPGASRSVIALRLSAPATYCFGDGSLATPCPCAAPDFVPNPSGAPGRGCANSLDIDGARLSARGSLNAALQLDALVAAGYTGYAFAVKASNEIASGAPLGDGVSCVGGTLVRFGGHNASSSEGWTYPTGADAPSIQSATGQPPGQLALYQVVYRNAQPGFCSPATINVTNGVRIDWPN